MDNLLKDSRFADIVKDPKFRRIPKKERKVKIDKRFQSMFTDKKFAVNFKVDKYGRPCAKSSAENLRKYYDISESDDEASSESDIQDAENEKSVKIESREKKEPSKKLQKSDNKLPGLKKSEKGKLSNNIKEKLKNPSVDYARGEGVLLSSSSEEESIFDSEEEDAICHNWGEFDNDAEEAVESTRRLAVCNMDWDKIRAVDLMVSLNSFLRTGGIILSVTIYPSEYGLERMKEEDVKGPMELVDNCPEEFDEIEEGSSYQMEKLRQYQLNRLKYYYAVIECDTAESADTLWNECRNVEYESSGLKFDLRFIPDDMEFDQTPKEVCDKLPDFATYEPRLFTTTALQQEKVDLTWDETNEERKEITQKINSGKLNELNDNHLKYLLASGSSEDESDENFVTKNHEDEPEKNMKGNSIEKYKQLLKSIDEKEKEKHKNDVQLECTWGYNAEKRSKEFEKEKQQKSENKTPFEEYLDKRKEKRKAKRKAKMEENSKDNNDMSGSEDEIPSDIDMNDPYFAEEFKSRTKNQKKSKKAKMDETPLNSNDNDEKDELELLLMDTNEIDNKKHFDMKVIEETSSMSKSKKKRLLKKKKNNKVVNNDDDFEMNLNDERFQALYTSHHFSIDPTDNHYRKTKGTEILVSEQLKRRTKDKN